MIRIGLDFGVWQSSALEISLNPESEILRMIIIFAVDSVP